MPGTGKRILATLSLVAVLLWTIAARAEIPGPAQEASAWKPFTTAAITYSSLYTIVVTGVRSTQAVMGSLVPIEWLATAQTYGTPLILVPIMAQLIPAVRQWAPQAADTLEHLW